MPSLRDVFGDALAELGSEKPDVVVLNADLSSASRTDRFAKRFPERHFNCGIAEENMLGMAAGLASFGYTPFVSGFSMFTACRAFEQIRNSIAYPRLNVKIAVTHGGLSVGEDGASHQCCEDFALMRTLPGMKVLCPCDGPEARGAVQAAWAEPGPVFLRFSRASVPDLHTSPDYKFQLGKAELMKEGEDVAILATGLMVSRALEAAQLLEVQGIHAEVWNFATIKPLDEAAVLQAAGRCHAVVTCEEHSVLGGFGEAVAAVLAEQLPTKMRRIGLKDRFGSSGSSNELFAEYGLDAMHIAGAAKELLMLPVKP